jgi:GNAT superfamily N-acetyltransferase
MNATPSSRCTIRPATPHDVPEILAFIRELAEYENLRHEVSATEEKLRETLFGPRPYAEALIGCIDGAPAGFAVYFCNYSTFVASPGMYLEDIFVRPQFRKLGLGKALFVKVAQIAVERHCGRYEWSVLDWNLPSIRFYESLGAEMHASWRKMRAEGAGLAAMARM